MADSCDRQKPDVKKAGGFDTDHYTMDKNGAGDMTVRPYGKESVMLKFTDKVWLGPTEETIIIAYKDWGVQPQGVRKVAAKLSGTVSGPVASTGEMKSVSYSAISGTPLLYCVISF